TAIYSLSLHDALPIYTKWSRSRGVPIRPLMPHGIVTRIAFAGVSFGSCSITCGSELERKAVVLVFCPLTSSASVCSPSSFGTVRSEEHTSELQSPDHL